MGRGRPKQPTPSPTEVRSKAKVRKRVHRAKPKARQWPIQQQPTQFRFIQEFPVQSHPENILDTFVDSLRTIIDTEPTPPVDGNRLDLTTVGCTNQILDLSPVSITSRPATQPHRDHRLPPSHLNNPLTASPRDEAFSGQDRNRRWPRQTSSPDMPLIDQSSTKDIFHFDLSDCSDIAVPNGPQGIIDTALAQQEELDSIDGGNDIVWEMSDDIPPNSIEIREGSPKGKERFEDGIDENPGEQIIEHPKEGHPETSRDFISFNRSSGARPSTYKSLSPEREVIESSIDGILGSQEQARSSNGKDVRRHQDRGLRGLPTSSETTIELLSTLNAPLEDEPPFEQYSSGDESQEYTLGSDISAFDDQSEIDVDITQSQAEQSKLADLVTRLLINPRSVIKQTICDSSHIQEVQDPGSNQSDHSESEFPRDLNDDLARKRPLSLSSWLATVEDVPNVLDSASLRTGQNLDTDPLQRQRLFCGYTPDQTQNACPVLDIHRDNPSVGDHYETHFDVDSYILFADSLAVARDGLKVITIQKPTPALQSGMHLGQFSVWYHDDDNPTDVCAEGLLPIHQVPHITLGRFAANDDLELCIIFPHAARQGQKIAKLTNELYEHWVNGVFLPALYDVLPASQSRVLPSSFSDATSKSQVRSRNLITNRDTPRAQLLAYHVQGNYMQILWEAIIRYLHGADPRLQDCMILIVAKGIKGSTSSATWPEMKHKLNRKITQHINLEHKKLLFLDVGKESIHPHSRVGSATNLSGETAVWSTTYLRSIANQFRGLYHGTSNEGELHHKEYPSYFLPDTSGCTLEPLDQHPLRQHGLLYVQYYNATKDLFAAGDNYLASNPAVADMGLDSTKLAILRQVANAVTTSDQESLIRSYLHIKNHIWQLSAAEGKSQSTREEFRMRDDLFMGVDNRIMSSVRNSSPIVQDVAPRSVYIGSGRQGNYTYSPLPTRGAFLCLSTSDFLDWVQWNVNRFCIGIEHIFSDVPAGRMITWEQTRSVTMFFLGIALFLGSLAKTDTRSFWLDEYAPARRKDDLSPGEGAKDRQGMGMKDSMDRTGFPWFKDKLDWRSLTFRPELSPLMAFKTLHIEKRLRRHARSLTNIRESSERIEASQPWLEHFSQVSACRDLLFRFFYQICAHEFRRFVLGNLKKQIHERFYDDVELGSVALSFESLSDVLQQGQKGIFLKHRSQDKIRDWKSYCHEVYLDQSKPRMRNLPYRLPFRAALEVIQSTLGGDAASIWQNDYFSYLRATNWILPYPQNSRLMNIHRDGANASSDSRYQYVSVYHRDINSAVLRQRGDHDYILPPDWRNRLRTGWEFHTQRKIRGKPKLDIDLMETESDELYRLLCHSAGSLISDDDDPALADVSLPEVSVDAVTSAPEPFPSGMKSGRSKPSRDTMPRPEGSRRNLHIQAAASTGQSKIDHITISSDSEDAFDASPPDLKDIFWGTNSPGIIGVGNVRRETFVRGRGPLPGNPPVERSNLDGIGGAYMEIDED